MSDLKLEPKRIAIFLDGTWNTRLDNTNVWRLKSLCKQSAEQVIYYSKGVGTQVGTKIIGGALGYGIDQGVIDAYEWLIENYNDGDKLYIFGFSRGAYTARSLSGLISKCGLLYQGAPLSVRALYDRYRNRDTKGQKINPRTIRQLAVDNKENPENNGPKDQQERWMLKYCNKPDIHFLGVWDTVGSLGLRLPFGDIPYISSESYQFLETDLRLTNLHAYHALAIDEHRQKFAPTLWTKTADNLAKPREIEAVEQRWFAGAHANVGGGYPNDLLAQRPLQWLMTKANILGLEFRYEVDIDGDISDSECTDSYADFMGGIYKFLPFSEKHYRVIGNPKKEEYLTEPKSINETIDRSVFERWHKRKDYRPANLKSWADRHGITIESLIPEQTVKADNPTTVVPD